MKESAIEEQDNTWFDASGTHALEGAENTRSSHSRSTHEEDVLSTGVTSVTTSLLDINLTDDPDSDRLEKLPLDEKEKRLLEMFPSLSNDDIRHVLKETGSVFSATVDQLLSLAFIGDEQSVKESSESVVPKGIDGFIADENMTQKRKGRRKKKMKADQSSRASSAGSFENSGYSTPKNPWTSTEGDIGFLCNKTSLSYEAARKAYQSAGRNLAATIRNLALEKSGKYIGFDHLDPLVQVQIIDLKHEFEECSERVLYGLLILGQVPPAAQELATVMITNTSFEISGRRDDLIQYAPLKVFEESDVELQTPPSPATTLDPSRLHAKALHQSLAAEQAFSQASSAARRAKSDHLMGAAAHHYATEGHKRAQSAREYRAAAADAKVQMTRKDSNSIDLHGVSVVDAVRIARAETQRWWNGLGDEKYIPGGGGPVRAGFHVVTGVGRHSKDGAPKIGPAVGRALMKDGWQVVINQGEISVYGKIRH